MNFVKIRIYLPSRTEDLSTSKNVPISEAVINVNSINSIEKLYTPNGYSTIRTTNDRVYFIKNDDAELLIEKLEKDFTVTEIDATKAAAAAELTIHLD